MKRHILFASIFAMAIAFCACSSNNEPPTPTTQDEIEAAWPDLYEVTEAGTFVKVMRDTTGMFIMGDDNSSEANEAPAHVVKFSKSYYIGMLEVTQAQWTAIMGSNPSDIKGDNLPVNNIKYSDATKFIEKLNEKTGLTFRLPTEAEWEYAAMGGKLSQGYTYSGSNNVDEVAWYAGNSNDNLQPGGLKKANELGIYDMTGNVAEWCQDRCTAYKATEQTDPIGKTGGYAVRGGRFDDTTNGTNYLRCKARLGMEKSCKFYNLGLRLLLEEPKAAQ